MPKRNSQTAAFSNGGSANTLRLLVDQQQKLEIGLRIKELRDNSAETSRSIADHCDVSVEAVRNWIAGKGISYDNAVKVAEMFKVDETWLWRGQAQGETSDVTGALNGSAARIEAKLDDLLNRFDLLEASLIAAGIAQRKSEAAPQSEKARRGAKGR